MATYGADDFKNFWNNILPSSLTVTPWQCKIAKAIFDKTGDRKLKSWGGAQGWNVWIINKMLQAYASNKNIAKEAGVSNAVAEAFIQKLPDYQGIDVPEGPADMTADAIRRFLNSANATTEAVPVVLVVLAVGVAAYLLYAGKAGTKLTPF
jgi:hypothetical protein